MTAPDRPLLARLEVYRRTRTERGASLGELGLLEELKEEVERLREALGALVYLNDHPPETDHERALSAAVTWRQARAALARPAAAEAGE